MESAMMSLSKPRNESASNSGAATLRRRTEFPYAGLLVVALLVVWEIAVRCGGISRIVLPPPSAVAQDLAGHWLLFLQQAASTLSEIVVGFAISVMTGIPLAILLGASRKVEKALYPLIIASQTVPVVSVAPILLAWFGFGLRSKVIVVVLITFFPIMMNALTGMKAMSPLVRDLARSMGATRRQMLWHFQLPGALPSIFAGLKIAATLSVVGAVVAEFVGSDSGLGYEIMVAGSNLNLAHQFAAVFVLTLLGLGLFFIMGRIERLSLPWHVSIRGSADR